MQLKAIEKFSSLSTCINLSIETKNKTSLLFVVKLLVIKGIFSKAIRNSIKFNKAVNTAVIKLSYLLKFFNDC